MTFTQTPDGLAVIAAVEAHTRATIPPALRPLALSDLPGATRRLLERTDPEASLLVLARGDGTTVAVAVEVKHPLSARPGGVLHTLVAPPARRAAVRRAVEREATARGWSWLRERAPWFDGPRPAPWEPLYVRVTTVLRPGRGRGGDVAVPPGVVLRPAVAADAPALDAGLRESLAGGLASWESDGDARLAAHVARLLAQSSDQELLVAERGGATAGFALFDVAYADEFTGATETFLHDAFTFSGARGAGLASVLIDAVGARTPNRLLSGTVVGPAAEGAPVLGSLLARGWHARECVWGRPLP